MKAGRNDPCPCGSGKKYKKCCFARDQEASSKPAPVISPADADAVSSMLAKTFENIAKPARTSEPPTPPPPRDPIVERGDILWEEFEAESGEGRIAVFFKALEDPEAMTHDLAFEMLHVLYMEGLKSGERGRFEKCVSAFRERLPDAYEKESHYCLSWCLSNALAEDRQEVVPALARELAATAGRDIDIFNRAAPQLAYHGQLSALVEAMRIAWPFVKTSGNVVPWGIAEFAEKGVRYEILDYLEHTSNPDPTDASLLERIHFLIEKPNEQFLREVMTDLTGNSGREWKVEDFALKPRRKRSRGAWDDDADEDEEREAPDPGAANLSRLIAEFVGYLRREEGVPFSRGDMVSQELYRYFIRRFNGDLDPRPSMMESMLQPTRKLPKPPKPAHPLCPERLTLDAYLGEKLGFMNELYHTAAALFQAMPAWLRFLKSRGLIDAATREKVTAELIPLQATLLRLWEKHDDPLMLRLGKAWLDLP